MKPPARGLRPPRIKRVTADSQAGIARRSLLRADKDLVDEVDAVLMKGARRQGATDTAEMFLTEALSRVNVPV